MNCNAREAGGPLPQVVVVGGSSRFRGGLEIFCERAVAALRQQGGWDVVPLRADTSHLRPASVGLMLAGLAQMWRLARAKPAPKKPPYAWVQYSNMPDLAYVLLARALGLRVLVTPHLGVQWRSRSNPVLRAISTWALRWPHAIAFIAPTQRDELQPPAHVRQLMMRTFLPEAIVAGAAVTTPVAPQTPLRLLHAGRLSADKGTFRFVAVCAALRARGVAFSAAIAGGADDPAVIDQLRAAIAAQELEGQLAYLGPLAQDALVEQMRNSDALVHLSVQDSYPLIVLEAMACAMVPVCLDLAGARHMVQSYDGLIVAGDNSAEQAAQWLAQTAPEALRARGAAVADRVRADFGWPACAAALGAALDSVA